MEEVEGPTVPDETGQAKRGIGVAALLAQLTAT